VTLNKNGQQQDGKNNAELQTRWTKTTWKSFEGTIRPKSKQFYQGQTGDQDDDYDELITIELVFGKQYKS